MSGPLPCDNHPDQMAATLMTDLETGNTLTLCRDCLIDFAQMLVGVDFPEQYGQPAELGTTEEVADLEPASPAPDAGLKSEPEPAPPPAKAAKRRAEAAQEAPTSGE